MALTWTHNLYSDRVYSAYAPIIVGGRSDLHAEDAYRYRLKIYSNDNQELAALNQPPAGDEGECYFQIESILRDYLVARKEGDALSGQLRTSGQYLTERGKRFKLALSGRYIDASGNEQIETLILQQECLAFLSKPIMSAGFRNYETAGGTWAINWNIWAPSLDGYWKYDWIRWRSYNQNANEDNLNERPIFDATNLDQGLCYYGGTLKQRKTTVQKIISPPCYRTTALFYGQNPGTAPPGGANLEGGNVQRWQVLFYQEVGEEAFAAYDIVASYDPIYAGADFVLDAGIGYKNLLDGAAIPDQTLQSSKAWSISFHSATPVTYANQLGATIWCINECEDDPRWGEPINITFLNRRGGFETIIFYKSRSTSTRMTKRNTYTPHQGSFVTESTGQRFTFNPQVKVALPSQYQRSITLTSQYVSEEESILFEALITSPLIYLHAEDESNIMELICTTTNLVRQDVRGDGLIRYSVSFDFANIEQA